MIVAARNRAVSAAKIHLAIMGALQVAQETIRSAGKRAKWLSRDREMN
jgi:hypothetical protein